MIRGPKPKESVKTINKIDKDTDTVTPIMVNLHRPTRDRSPGAESHLQQRTDNIYIIPTSAWRTLGGNLLCLNI